MTVTHVTERAGEAALTVHKLASILPLTDETLADKAPLSSSWCAPWEGHACFVHTFPSWGCPGSWTGSDDSDEGDGDDD